MQRNPPQWSYHRELNFPWKMTKPFAADRKIDPIFMLALLQSNNRTLLASREDHYIYHHSKLRGRWMGMREWWVSEFFSRDTLLEPDFRAVVRSFVEVVVFIKFYPSSICLESIEYWSKCRLDLLCIVLIHVIRFLPRHQLSGHWEERTDDPLLILRDIFDEARYLKFRSTQTWELCQVSATEIRPQVAQVIC